MFPAFPPVGVLVPGPVSEPEDVVGDVGESSSTPSRAWDASKTKSALKSDESDPEVGTGMLAGGPGAPGAAGGPRLYCGDNGGAVGCGWD